MLLLAAAALAADPVFSVRPYGWIRAGWQWREDDPALVSDSDGFLAQARMGLEAGSDAYKVHARIEADLQPEPSLKDAFVNWTPTPAFSLNLGQMKLPFMHEQLSSDLRRQFPTNADIVGAMGLDRDMGVLAEGRLPIAGKVRATLSGGLFNGEGPNRLENVNDRYLTAARLTVTPLGARERPFEGTGRDGYVGLFGSYIYNYTGSGDSAIETNSWSAGAQFAWRWLSLQGEWANRETVHGSVDVQDFDTRGGYGQLGLFIPAPWVQDHVELVGRGGYTEPNDQFADDLSQQEVITAEGGLNLYVPETPRWMHDLKLQVAYRHPMEQEGDPADDDQLNVLVGAGF